MLEEYLVDAVLANSLIELHSGNRATAITHNAETAKVARALGVRLSASPI